MEKAFGVIGTEPRAPAARHQHDGPMAILAARLAERTGSRGVGRRFRQTDLGATSKRPQPSANSLSPRERAVEQRQAVNAAPRGVNRCSHWIDAAQLEDFARRLKPRLAHLSHQPIAGNAVDFGSRAMDALLFEGLDNFSDASLRFTRRLRQESRRSSQRHPLPPRQLHPPAIIAGVGPAWKRLSKLGSIRAWAYLGLTETLLFTSGSRVQVCDRPNNDAPRNPRTDSTSPCSLTFTLQR